MMELLPSDDGWEAISISMPKELQSSLLEISLSCKIDDEVINKFLAHFTFADVIRISEMRTLRIAYPLRYEKKFCEMATIPTCILRCFYSFISASIPLSNSSSIFLFFYSTQIYFCTLYYLSMITFYSVFPEIYRMDYNTLRLNGRVVVVVIVPFFHPLAALHVCIFLCIRTFFLGQKSRKVGHVLFMHLGFLSS